jgi:L-alanine-DL-glutamate epimerase-like enolase superfamily enzyme
VVLTRIEHEGVSGYGEASMPPYLGESHETATGFLSRVDLEPFRDPFRMEEILEYVDRIAPGNPAAKASVDMALHDLVGRLMGQPWYRILGLSPEKAPMTSFTIGIDREEVVREKVREAGGFGILKVKLGRDTDRMMIETIRSETDVPLCVDVNQGWTDRQEALDTIHWLHGNGVQFVEQPMPRDRPDDNAWLTQHSPLPIIADEAVRVAADLPEVFQVYSGVNVKLMKCGGMREAHRMMEVARALGMKVMIGCMTETSCAVSAAAQLSPLVDWADLDGNLLIRNDVFEGVQIVQGKITLPPTPGIGVTPSTDLPLSKR